MVSSQGPTGMKVMTPYRKEDFFSQLKVIKCRGLHRARCYGYQQRRVWVLGQKCYLVGPVLCGTNVIQTKQTKRLQLRASHIIFIVSIYLAAKSSQNVVTNDIYVSSIARSLTWLANSKMIVLSNCDYKTTVTQTATFMKCCHHSRIPSV